MLNLPEQSIWKLLAERLSDTIDSIVVDAQETV